MASADKITPATSPPPRNPCDTVPWGLAPDQVQTFHEDGYLIVPRALSSGTAEKMRREIHDRLTSFSLEGHPMTRFDTGGENGENHVSDAYFLSSGDKICYFFEPAAFDKEGNLTKPKEKAVNKIGHGLHMLSKPFMDLLDEKKCEEAGDVSPAAIARCIGFKDPRCLQSMVICKQPEIGGAVPAHQDSTFLYTNPPSAVGFWYALEDANLGNGCLSFLPGSHKWAPIEKRYVRKPAGMMGTEFMDNKDKPRFPDDDGSGIPYGEEHKPEGADKMEYKPGEVKAGDLVLIHGNLLHKSETNTSDRSRWIYTFHVIENQGKKYEQLNWLQPGNQGFTPLYQ